MPFIVAPVALAVVSGVIANLAWTTIAINALIAGGLALAKHALQGKENRPEEIPFSRIAAERTHIVRSSVEPHRVAYGTTKLSGVLNAAFASSDRQYLHMVLGVTGHRIRRWQETYFNDSVSTDSRFAGHYRVNRAIGLALQEADADTVADVPEWTTAHRGRTIGAIYARLKWSQTVWPTGIPNVSAVLDGRLVLDPRDTGVAITASAIGAPGVIHAPGHGRAVGDQIWIADHAGATTAAGIALAGEFEVATVPDVDHLTVADPWRGIEAVELTAGGTGGTLYEMRWTNNAALCVLDWMLLPVGARAGLDEINLDLVIAAANVSDEAVAMTVDGRSIASVDPAADTITLAEGNFCTGDTVQVAFTGSNPGGVPAATNLFWRREGPNTGSLATTLDNARQGIVIDITSAGSGDGTAERHAQPRYTIDGAFKLDAIPPAILEDLLASMLGAVIYTQGEYHIHAGHYTAPVGDTIDETYLRDEIAIVPRTPVQELYQRVRGTYVDHEQNWAPTEFPERSAPAVYEVEDNADTPQYRDVQFQYIIDVYRAERLAEIILRRSREALEFAFPCNYMPMEFVPWDVVGVSIDILTWVDKPFRLTEMMFPEEGGIDLVGREESASLWDWTPGDEVDPDVSPNSSFPGPFDVPAIAVTSVQSGTAQLDVAGDGTIVSRIRIDWTLPTLNFVVNGGRIDFRFRPVGGSVWSYEPVRGDLDNAFLVGVVDGLAYDIEADTVTSQGIHSGYAAIAGSPHTVIGKTAPPSDVTGFSAQQNGPNVTFRWDKITDRDLAGVSLKRTAQGSSDWNAAQDITLVTKGTLITNAAVPPGSWTLLAKAVDTTGNESTNVAAFNLDVVNAFDVIVEVDEHPRWVGTKTGCYVHSVSGNLVPRGTTDVADDDWSTFDEFVPNPVAVAYYESGEIDLGFDDDAVRVYAGFTAALGFGETGSAVVSLAIDYRNEADAYTGWKPWTIGTVDARRIKFRIAIETALGVSYLATFSPAADQAESQQSGEDLVVGIGGTSVVFADPYHNKPNVQVQVDGTSALIAMKSNVTTAGFTVQVFNTAGTDVGGVVDWQAIGI